jgi:hypothetical protein
MKEHEERLTVFTSLPSIYSTFCWTVRRCNDHVDAWSWKRSVVGRRLAIAAIVDLGRRARHLKAGAADQTPPALEFVMSWVPHLDMVGHSLVVFEDCCVRIQMLLYYAVQCTLFMPSLPHIAITITVNFMPALLSALPVLLICP